MKILARAAEEYGEEQTAAEVAPVTPRAGMTAL